MKMSRWLMVVAVSVGAWTAGLQAQLSTDTLKAQNKLLAIRAARADAIRKLGERIQGLFITSTTHVKDFVTQKDEIRTAMTAWLSGMKEVGPAKYNEDGTAEVVVEITMEEVIINLQQISERYQKGGKYVAKDFEQMTVTNNDKVLRETGMGASRALEDPGATIALTASGAAYDSIDNMSGAARAWWLKNVSGQQRLMAVRGARVDGMRKLAERIRGVFISSKTTVRDFITESDNINVDMATFMKGFRDAAVRYHDDEPIVEVDVEITMTEVLISLKSWGEAHYKGDKVNLKSLEELTVQSKDKKFKETGMAVARTNPGVEVSASVTVAANAPAWISETMEAVGMAAIDTRLDAGQGKLMAKRGAELDARRKLAEQLTGLMITSSTSVKDFVTQKDEINTHMMDFQVGAHERENSFKVKEDGTVEVTVEIELRPLWNFIMYYHEKFKMTIK